MMLKFYIIGLQSDDGIWLYIYHIVGMCVESVCVSVAMVIGKRFIHPAAPPCVGRMSSVGRHEQLSNAITYIK